MKSKKISRKLALNKTTVTNLVDLENVKGGVTVVTNHCNSVCSCYPECSSACETVYLCVSVQTGCYPKCTVPACPV